MLSKVPRRVAEVSVTSRALPVVTDGKPPCALPVALSGLPAGCDTTKLAGVVVAAELDVAARPFAVQAIGAPSTTAMVMARNSPLLSPLPFPPNLFSNSFFYGRNNIPGFSIVEPMIMAP